MNNITILKNKLTAIADAVRTKTGSTDTMTLDTMAREIKSVTGQIENKISEIFNGSITSYSGNATVIRDYAFYGCYVLADIDLQNVTSIGSMAFYGCYALTSADLSSVQTLNARTFGNCTGLTKVWIPSTVTTITGSAPSNLPFFGCSSTLEIYTDVEDEDSIPSGWGTYWNYCTSGTLTVHYGATHDEYEAA